MSADLLIRLPDYFSSLIDAMQDGFVLRSTDGTVVDVNRAFCRMTGFDRTKVVGARPPHPWWPEEYRHLFDAAFTRYPQGEAAEDELVYKRKNEERFPVLVTSAPLMDAHGQIIAYIGTAKDMTEHRRVAEEQRFLADAARLLGSSLVTERPSRTSPRWRFPRLRTGVRCM